MNPTLHDEILTRVLESTLTPAAQNLIDAACQGASTLAEHLAHSTTANPPLCAPTPTRTTTPTAPLYLDELEVRAFRGIGPSARLTLAPGPGLTLVLGRNGSGKSSFAEALEALLTGTAGRWKDRHQAWKQGWKNLHEPTTSQIVARFVGPHDRKLEVRRTWADGAELEASTVTTTPAHDALADARAAISTFRPFLSYADLGTLLAGEPSRLFDELNGILGLDDLNDAIKLLTTERKRKDDETKALKHDLDKLLAQLATIDHPEAAACRGALAVKKPDLEHVETVARGESTDTGGDVAAMRRLAALTHPNLDEVVTLAQELREATSRTETLASASAAHAGELAELLDHALRYHQAHGGDCPTCNAPLSPTWSSERTAQLETLRTQSQELQAASIRSTQLQQRGRSLIQAPPAAVNDAVRLGLGDGAGLAWQRWFPAPSGSHELAAHLERHVLELIETVTALRTAAATKLQVLDADWRPAANHVLGWVQRARESAGHVELRKALKAAEQWLGEAEQEIRNARFAPIADQTQHIWSQLRHSSNVDLASISLAGNKTRRHVALDVTVDGTSGVAVGVMSQGELNALALSLFLPRMALPGSPFGFVVIDDPVQAMDPHKVDGLARVLAEFAATRQVIVFTHDTRLSDAIRNLQIDAQILEVTRRGQSAVEVRPVYDPARRALDDARALLFAQKEVGDEVLMRLVPALGRTAIEAACVAAIRRRGVVPPGATDIQDALDHAKTTHQLLALALLGDANRGADVYASVNNRLHPGAADALRACKEGAHGDWNGDARGLVEELGRIVGLLQRQT